MAKRPLARLATPASRPVTYSPWPGRGVGQPALGGHLFADALDLSAFERSDGAARDGEVIPAIGSEAHLHQPLGAADQGLFRLLAETQLAHRRLEAVPNAMLEPWSNGQTEGQINKLKTLKRAMYGRAGVELLRAPMMPL